jgi:acyl dehydratase
MMGKKVLYYKDIEKGQKFADYEYTFNEETIIKYCQAVGEDASIYTDREAAKGEGYPALAAPATTAAIYVWKGFLGEVDMPGGSLHATQEFEFVHPALAGDIITTTSKVLDKFELNGRKHAVIEAVAKNQNGQVIVKSRMGGIWAE